MNSHDTSGPAFPSTNQVEVGDFITGGHPGMTLRQYAAIQIAAAQATATSADTNYLNPDYRRSANEPTAAEKIAQLSVKVADALIAELARERDQ